MGVMQTDDNWVSTTYHPITISAKRMSIGGNTGGNGSGIGNGCGNGSGNGGNGVARSPTKGKPKRTKGKGPVANIATDVAKAQNFALADIESAVSGQFKRLPSIGSPVTGRLSPPPHPVHAYTHPRMGPGTHMQHTTRPTSPCPPARVVWFLP